MHVSVDNLVVCAPLSLLPQLKIGEKAPVANLEAIQDVECPKPLQDLATSDPVCKENTKELSHKVTTRQKLLAINLSMKNLMNLRLVDFQAPVVFRPPKASEKRFYYKDVSSGKQVAYLWDTVDKTSTPQHCQYQGFPRVVRCSTLSDEGDYTGNLAMCEAGLAIFPHRDCEHKLAREECLAMSDVPEIHLAVNEIFLVMKHDAAPWGNGMFGRRLKEAYQRVHELPLPHLLLDVVGASMINEMKLPPNTSQAELKQILVDTARGLGRGGGRHKKGRWSEFVDSFGQLRKQWSIKLFFILFAKALEGLNPFHAIAEACSAQRNEEKLPIQPRVLRVP